MLIKTTWVVDAQLLLVLSLLAGRWGVVFISVGAIQYDYLRLSKYIKNNYNYNIVYMLFYAGFLFS